MRKQDLQTEKNQKPMVTIDPDNEDDVTLLWHLYENVQGRYDDGPDGLAEALRDYAKEQETPMDSPTLDPDAEVCGCPEQQYDLHAATGCLWFPPFRDSMIEGAKERVARRAALRKEAAEAGRLLPAAYRENLRQQFERGEAEARFIVRGESE